MSSFNTRQQKVRDSHAGTPYATLSVVERCREVGASLTRPLAASSPMNASETSPSEGHECDGESCEQIVRSLLEQRVDGIRMRLHEAVVEARAELKAGGDVEAVLHDLGAEIDHCKYEVQEALEALEGDEE